MIVPLTQAESHHSLNVETDELGIALVEIRHVRNVITERETVEIVVSVYDDDVIVETTVKSS